MCVYIVYIGLVPITRIDVLLQCIKNSKFSKQYYNSYYVYYSLSFKF